MLSAPPTSSLNRSAPRNSLPVSTSSSGPELDLWILILAGGIGSRFWPVSTPTRPKQLLPLGSDRPLISDTVDRARAIVSEDRIRVLTGSHLVPAIRKRTGLPESSFLVEPVARGTCPVLAWATWTIHQEHPLAVVASLHADHVISPEPTFAELLIDSGIAALRERLLLTTAVEPTRPETGYGYIEPGDSVGLYGSANVARVKSFVEKPTEDVARSYIAQGFLWNSGIFIWHAGTFLEELQHVAPEVAVHLAHLREGDVEAFFKNVPTTTIDEAVFERSGRVGTVRATFQWDDVGSWEALSRTRSSDPGGNVTVGELHAIESRRNVVFSDEGPVVLFGVEDLVVVRTIDTTFVTTRSRSPDLKKLLEALPDHLLDPDTGS
jgi:mannose-1-phosphate guanylyltransferase